MTLVCIQSMPNYANSYQVFRHLLCTRLQHHIACFQYFPSKELASSIINYREGERVDEKNERRANYGQGPPCQIRRAIARVRTTFLVIRPRIMIRTTSG